jgi:ribosomal-protein-alanine N-acetyltransferase
VRTILHTERLTLREFLAQDTDALAVVLSDPEAMKYFPAPLNLAQTKEWIDRNQRRYAEDGVGLWAMAWKATGEVIGDCGIIRQQVDGEYLFEIGYHLRRDHWGQGIATEAAIACREWGFANLNVERIISLIRPENTPSRRVAQRNGMTIWKEVEWRGLRHFVYAVERPKPNLLNKLSA